MNNDKPMNNVNNIDNLPNEAPLNVIPNQGNNNQNFNNEFNQNQNTFIPNAFTNNTTSDFNSYEDENQLFQQTQNRFINNNDDSNITTLNDMNVDGAYHNLPKIDYADDPTVQANLEKLRGTKKNTISITKEGLVFIVIVIVLFVFILFMPTLYNAFKSIIS